MRNTAGSRWVSILFMGSSLAILDGCPLPDRFFENSVRSFSAAIANQLITEAVLDILGVDVSGTVDTSATDGTATNGA